jgi:hypothetical protein
MARKRGGLAGFYDRNKGVLQAAAPFIAGAVGGPLAGAAVGAAMRGFDREGQSGIGFDLGQGLQGGISGYGAGSLGASAKNLFTGQLAKRAAAKGLEAGTEQLSKLPTSLISDAQIAGTAGAPAAAMAPAASAGGFNAANYLADNAAQGASRTMQLGKGVLTTNPTAATGSPWYKTREGLDALSRGGQAAASIMGSQAQSAQAQREYEDQQRQLQARAELMALFAPQMAGNLGIELSGIRPAAGPMTTSFNQYANDAAMLATGDDRVAREMEVRGPFNLFGQPPIYGNPRNNFTTGPNRRTWMNNPERY